MQIWATSKVLLKWPHPGAPKKSGHKHVNSQLEFFSPNTGGKINKCPQKMTPSRGLNLPCFEVLLDHVARGGDNFEETKLPSLNPLN